MATDVKVDRVGEHVFKWRSDSLKSASGGKNEYCPGVEKNQQPRRCTGRALKASDACLWSLSRRPGCGGGARRSPKMGGSAAPRGLSGALAPRTAEPGPRDRGCPPCGSKEDFNNYYARKTHADNGWDSQLARLRPEEECGLTQARGARVGYGGCLCVPQEPQS